MERLYIHIDYLQKLIRDLSDHLARSGKNKKIREQESAKISHAVDQLEKYLDINQDLSDLLLEYHGGNEYGYNETLTFQYIVRDTCRLIEFLKAKIDEENETSSAEKDK